MSTERDPVFGCELWTGPRDRDGYGRDGRRLAHIAAYEREYGAIPDDHVLDHLCRRRHCVALHHLEPVKQSENELRKSWGRRARRTHCPRGHELATNAVVTPEGGRVCRACNREANGGTT